MDVTSFTGIGGMGMWGGMSLFFVLLLVWSLFWKGFGLWYAARRGEQWWFIAMLVLNTAGVLEIVYIFFFAKIPEFRKKLGLDK